MLPLDLNLSAFSHPIASVSFTVAKLWRNGSASTWRQCSLILQMEARTRCELKMSRPQTFNEVEKVGDIVIGEKDKMWTAKK